MFCEHHAMCSPMCVTCTACLDRQRQCGERALLAPTTLTCTHRFKGMGGCDLPTNSREHTCETGIPYSTSAKHRDICTHLLSSILYPFPM